MTLTKTMPASHQTRDPLAAHYGRIGISAVASMTLFLAENRDQAAQAKAKAALSASAGNVSA
jgi:hypothetical protein